MDSSSLWTYYSMQKLQKEFPRLTSFIKVYDNDIKKKAKCFEPEDIAEFVKLNNISTPYWLVLEAVLIVAFCGDIRHLECMSLCLEKVCSKPKRVFYNPQPGQAAFR